jgi:hypothetical protein
MKCETEANPGFLCMTEAPSASNRAVVIGAYFYHASFQAGLSLIDPLHRLYN